MGKKSTARAAAVAQYLAGAAESASVTKAPRKSPRSAFEEPRVWARDASWSGRRFNQETEGYEAFDPSAKTSFQLEVYYTDDEKNEEPTVFEVTVREVKS